MNAVLVPLFALFCLFWPADGEAQQSVKLWDVAGGRETDLGRVLPTIRDANLVLVGEQHDNRDHHAAQLRIIQTLHNAGKPIAVALEMIEHRLQPILDGWGSGQMEEKTFVPYFQASWGNNWPLYRDIFVYCRDHGIPMVGLNVPREITSQVARKGFASLTPEQVGLLPMVTCRVDREYMELMRQAHGHGSSDEQFIRFCEAQLVWDTAMAVYSMEYIGKNPERTVVLLAGSVHAWKKGIPARIREQSPGTRYQVFLPNTPGGFEKGAVTSEDADYLILMP